MTGPLGTKMVNLNEAIKQLNREPMWTKKTLSSSKEEIIRRSVAEVTAPSFHTWGVDRAKAIEHGQASGYRYADWRERQKNNMLHLNDRVRARAGMTVLKYFERLYNLPSRDELEGKIPTTKDRNVQLNESFVTEPSTSTDIRESDQQSETSEELYDSDETDDSEELVCAEGMD